MALLPLGALGVGSGCSSGDGESRAWAAGSAGPSEGVTIEAKGKPRDVAAAVSRSLAPVELAVVEEKPLDGGGREFLLVGLQGEEGVLRVEFAEGSPQELAWRREVIEMRLTAQVGLFGNAARERDLVEKVSRELRTLGRQP